MEDKVEGKGMKNRGRNSIRPNATMTMKLTKNLDKTCDYDDSKSKPARLQKR